MIRLIWKEYRERRLWIALLVLSVVAVTAFRRPYTFLGFWNLVDPTWLVSVVIALLYGLTSYSSEIGWGTPDFLFSRAISPRKVVCAKLVTAYGTMLAAALLGSTVLRLWAPDSHVGILTFYRLQGIGIAMIVMGMPYLLGFASSVVFPGFFGAVIVLLATQATNIILHLTVSEVFKGPVANIWLTPIWTLVLIVAAVLSATRWLTSTTYERAKRYFVVLAYGAVLIVIVSLGFRNAPAAVANWLLRSTHYWFSPDAKYAVVSVERPVASQDSEPVRPKGTSYIVRLSDSLTHKLNWPLDASSQPIWTADGTACIIRGEYLREAPEIITARIDNSGKLRKGRLKLWKLSASWIAPSPSGRYAAVFRKSLSPGGKSKHIIGFVDISRTRRLAATVTDYDSWWWQDGSTFAWTDKQGKRHFLRLPH